eukprot:749378-Hanusia_phi.AAC.2
MDVRLEWMNPTWTSLNSGVSAGRRREQDTFVLLVSSGDPRKDPSSYSFLELRGSVLWVWVGRTSNQFELDACAEWVGKFAWRSGSFKLSYPPHPSYHLLFILSVLSSPLLSSPLPSSFLVLFLLLTFPRPSYAYFQPLSPALPCHLSPPCLVRTFVSFCSSRLIKVNEIISLRWIEQGKEPPDFWESLGGQPAAGEEIAREDVLISDEMYEHFPHALPAHPKFRRPPSRESLVHVAVIGGGVAGAACAAHLSRKGENSGIRVTVFEAAEDTGGRVRSVKHRIGGGYSVSGCRFFSAVGPEFRQQVDQWVRRGLVVPYGSSRAVGMTETTGRSYRLDAFPLNLSNPFVLSAARE